MPVYSFVCDHCGRPFDRKLPISQVDVEQSCPFCQHGARRVFQVPAVIFKGSGFYVTDHQKNRPERS